MPMVLLVGSVLDTLKGMERLLYGGGYDTTLALDAGTISSRVTIRPDVIIADLCSDPKVEFATIFDELPFHTRAPVIVAVSLDTVAQIDVSLPFADFFLWPGRPDEALARVRWALWKHSRLDPDHTIRTGDLVIDTQNYRVQLNNRPVDLTPKEYQLLYYLATHADRVLSRELLLNEVWGAEYVGGVRTVDVHVRRLRSKIEDPSHVYIDTVRNAGYRFQYL